MALQKQPIPLNFSQGLDTKTDDKQVTLGKFIALNNSVFDKAMRLTKRNGFPLLTTLPNALQTTLTTLNNNLIATGSNLYAYSANTSSWLNQGKVQPIQVDTQTMVRVSTSQSSPDVAVAPSGLACLVYIDSAQAYYQVSDSATGQQIVARTALSATATNPRVFLLGTNFIITFMATVGGNPYLQYVAIPIAVPSSPSAVTDIDTTVLSITTGYDGIVSNNNLYLAWSGSSTTIRMRLMSASLAIAPALTLAGSHTADVMSLSADSSSTNIWISFWDGTSFNMYTAVRSSAFNAVLAATLIVNTGAAVVSTLTSVVSNALCTIMYETAGTYGGTIGSVKTDFISKATINSAATVVAPVVILRSVGLASKSFIDASGSIYALATYGETNQPTYFLIDSTGAIYARLAYSNGGGYQPTQVLPSVTLLGSTYLTPYLNKDFLAAVNKGTNLPANSPVNGIYTQTGVNLFKLGINTSGQYSSEIAGALHLTGGQLWEYDGVRPVEHGFHVYPENVASSTATGSGGLVADTYYYSFTYEWTDNAGNLHRSAPSIPVKQVTTTASSTNTLYVPYLRLTYKIAPNPVRIVGYRWSVLQQVYYQFTSITSPTVNDPTNNYATIVDTLASTAILGNVLLYTTGGVVENIAAPASIASAMFKNRLFLIDAEDQNLLWFSKQVIETVPVEMSDLFTVYVAPTTGAQGSTGPMKAISAMDDKLIIFKKDAMYYLTGAGPDNTGSQNDFSEPIYITSSIGCANPNSIVLMPSGLMFQSDKGIWLLGRDLQTSYIGAPVEQYNSNVVKSAQVIPGTNQVRFILDNNITLMYDYFFNQWGTFSNIFAISSTLFNGLDTYLNSYGQVLQEKPGTYIDNATPVLLSFSTSWIALAGIQGLERLYFAHLLGTYFSPFKLNVQIAYDYNASPEQSIMVTPDNFTPTWGGEANWGSGAGWGGNGNIFEARVFPQKQKCQSVQFIVNEVYDASLGVAAGQGLTLSGLQLTVGVKRGFRTQSSGKSFG